MSIKGIDAQMMVTRASDVAKDSSAQLKRGELMQDYLAVQAKTAQDREKQMVGETAEIEKTAIHMEKDADSGGDGYEPSSGQQKQGRGKKDPLADLKVSGEDHKIDITI